MGSKLDKDDASQMWHEILVVGHRDRPSSFLPGGPRCAMCDIPMGGVGGFLMKSLRGRVPSRKNPHMCNM